MTTGFEPGSVVCHFLSCVTCPYLTDDSVVNVLPDHSYVLMERHVAGLKLPPPPCVGFSFKLPYMDIL